MTFPSTRASWSTLARSRNLSADDIPIGSHASSLSRLANIAKTRPNSSKKKRTTVLSQNRMAFFKPLR